MNKYDCPKCGSGDIIKIPGLEAVLVGLDETGTERGIEELDGVDALGIGVLGKKLAQSPAKVGVPRQDSRVRTRGAHDVG